MAQVATEQVRQGFRVTCRVVHPIDERDLIRDPPPGGPGMVASGVDHLSHGPASVERHEHVAQGVSGGVQADRQGELRSERGQPADAGHDARRGDRDMASPEPKALRVGQCRDGLQHPVQVEQRLTHAHEHDVRQASTIERQAARHGAHLVDDLRGLEISAEAELAGGTERAAHGAARLAGDAHRVSLALTGPGRIVHEHRLDEGTVGQAVQGLFGQAAIRHAQLGLGQSVEPEGRIQLRAQVCGQGEHIRSAGGMACPQCLRHLARPVGRFLSGGEPVDQGVGREAGQARPRVSDRQLGHGPHCRTPSGAGCRSVGPARPTRPRR